MAVEKVDIEKLINEIENRSALWDMRKNEYNDTVIKRKCWEEIVDLFANKNSRGDEKKTLSNELHKKWKHIRDNFSIDLQRKGKSGAGGQQKAPYVYSKGLQFLVDIITPKETTNSLEPTETTNHESSLQFDNRPETSSPIPTKQVRSKQIGKKRLHAVEDKILTSLENYEKRTKKAVVEDDNHYFALSLVPTLSSLTMHLNTKCRLEIMQTLSKYIMQAEQSHLPPPQPTYSIVHYLIQSALVPDSQQQYETSQNMNSQQSILVLPPAPSPVESAASYVSAFSEDDSQFSIF